MVTQKNAGTMYFLLEATTYVVLLIVIIAMRQRISERSKGEIIFQYTVAAPNIQRLKTQIKNNSNKQS